MNKLRINLEILDNAMGKTLRIICITCFCILFFLMMGNVFVRYFPVMSFHWFDEIVEWTFAWLVFFGSAALWRDKEHFRIQWIQDKLQKKQFGKLIKAFLDLLSVFFFIILAYQGYKLTSRAMDWTAFFNIPKKIIYSCIPISGFIMLIYSIRDVVQDILAIYFSTSENQIPS